MDPGCSLRIPYKCRHWLQGNGLTRVLRLNKNRASFGAFCAHFYRFDFAGCGKSGGDWKYAGYDVSETSSVGQLFLLVV